MAAKPLEAEYREELTTLLKKKNGLALSKSWGIDRGTLAEAALGLPKQEGTRLLIKTRMDAQKKPI